MLSVSQSPADERGRASVNKPTAEKSEVVVGRDRDRGYRVRGERWGVWVVMVVRRGDFKLEPTSLFDHTIS